MFCISHVVVKHVRLVNQPLVTVVALCQKRLDTPAEGPSRRRNRVHSKRLGNGLQIHGIMSFLLLEVCFSTSSYTLRYFSHLRYLCLTNVGPRGVAAEK